MKRAALYGSLGALVCACGIAAAQSPDDARARTDVRLATDLIGKAVTGPNGEKLGSVQDLVVSPAGSIWAAVVSVGGFLGIGAKQVEIPYDQVQLGADRSIVVAMTRDELAAAPGFSRDVARHYAERAAEPGEVARPPATQPPDADAQRQADAEAARGFATDDPRVAKGIAENKEAFDDDGKSGVAQPQ
jgi:sporulation protein YlmC with PRC-barrel domain